MAEGSGSKVWGFVPLYFQAGVSAKVLSMHTRFAVILCQCILNPTHKQRLGIRSVMPLIALTLPFPFRLHREIPCQPRVSAELEPVPGLHSF